MSLKNLIQSINKKDGENTVKFFGEDINLPKLPTGVFTLDAILRGGIPRASVTEILGQESTGKSTLCYHIIAQSQKLIPNRHCVYIDMEHAFNPKYAKDAGVDLTSLVFIQPQNGNKATDYVELFAKTGEVSLIVLDSVAALVTEQEEQSSMDETTMSLGTARLMAKFCRKIPPVLSATDTTLIMINQWREKPTPYGNPKVSYGGHALKYTAKLRLDLSKKTDAETGFRITAKVLKNKAGGDPLKEAEYTIKFGEGIDQLGSLIEYAMEAGIIERRSSNYYFAGEMIAKGREAVIDQIKADRNLFDQVATAALTKIAEISQPTSSALNKTSSIDYELHETSLDDAGSDCVENLTEE